ncbi:MAG: hypothetical protein ACPLXO_03830, partial [Desulfurella sp.]
ISVLKSISNLEPENAKEFIKNAKEFISFLKHLSELILIHILIHNGTKKYSLYDPKIQQQYTFTIDEKSGVDVRVGSNQVDKIRPHILLLIEYIEKEYKS